MRERPNPDALVTATEVSRWLGRRLDDPSRPVVSVPLIGMWRRDGHLPVKGWRGRSPLYRLGDVQTVEARMARAAIEANNHRARRVA